MPEHIVTEKPMAGIESSCRYVTIRKVVCVRVYILDSKMKMAVSIVHLKAI